MEVHTSIPCKAIHYRDRISASSYTNNNSCQGIGLGTATPKCLPWTDLKIRRNKALVGKQRCEEKKMLTGPNPKNQRLSVSYEYTMAVHTKIPTWICTYEAKKAF